MSYKIAVGSSDGVNVNLKFGEVDKFLIYEVSDEIKLAEERKYIATSDSSETEQACNSSCKGTSKCGGNGGGCSGPSEVSSKVALIEDCRCVVCLKIGFQAQKQFEKKAISVFDVDCDIKTALEKITFYYKKIDNHEPFRK